MLFDVVMDQKGCLLSPSNIIRIAAVLIPNDQDQILCVRKEGTELFMFPGGKQELWETPAQAAANSRKKTSIFMGVFRHRQQTNLASMWTAMCLAHLMCS
ncbi:hypothetical protein CYL77_05530 [Corynebacterium glutamicum]|uniref:Nudix hydrolase domain-containing protein n=1 Tax=Corynebacterium glutamicum (strain ATCC 13032 / DSM 20300 / JCM 1318 / BCRC 11384 / CCUG 27702 / LMG 3730 / NBRC 12168 / NCIMB 10025 / NRRL B-2784 / 534) TaxID=196627 RepID=Q8NRF8_CORGL|nr:hypothetical protein B7P23_07470 [Corynebacterium glutamicum]AUI00632.1 hypothetical protein CYL77_05530 [Corynebacterium glutamicum]AUI04276.1 hypothetical protein C0I99_09225 [Corynebacterium glutamicum]BAB98484.1 Hypothetical protein [Corynebacterium glutamicum ATCC 13032]CCH24266.1 hypothetical protein WA5_1046 [Corynebacterium glutamicum K051]